MRPYRLRMELQLFAGEKTEQATPRKRQDARKKGQVAKSMEVPASLVLLSVLLILFLYGSVMRERIEKLFTVTFTDYMHMELTFSNITLIFAQLMSEGLILLAPLFLIVVVVAFLALYFQVGLMVTGDPLIPKFDKLDPLKGVANLFKLRSVIELIKSILKMSIIGGVVFYTIWKEKQNLIQMAEWPLGQTFAFTGHLILILGLQIAVILLILALFDYFYQKYEFEKSLRMSKDDIRQEYKNTEGDPLIKGKIREKQKRMAMMRMMQDVPKADVVITNPTHFAVAMKYDPQKSDAPVVLAKGMDYIALRIRQVAKENGVVTMENKPLARALYEQVEIGQTIPADLFQAVAEVLAYVYKLKGKVK
ncbi:flagellar biosynthesis protein FlhB [Paenibacillus sp. HJGM_3]|uniref:flagellar biosynthesis protein FlhB n=1 Tax=Paenibacillus sp. HJGM_3 TaxID=3379816 RepID=UPI003859CE5D